MRLSLRLLLLPAVLAGSFASAQTISISNFSAAGNFTQGDFTTSIDGTGSATMSPGGNATLAINGSTTRDRGTNCAAADVIQLSTTLQFNATDTLTFLFSAPAASGKQSSVLSLTGTFNVTGGTGAYAGKGGSGSMSLTVTISVASASSGTFTMAGSASGTLTAQLVPQPTILPSGVVPVFSNVTVIQPGSWISIYGTNFASTTTLWNGDFPTSLGGVSVRIDGKLGYLWFVSPTQINVQAPDDSTPACATVEIDTPNGQAISAVTLAAQGPSLNLWGDGKHAAAIIYTSSGYDLLAPVGLIPGVTTRPVKVGETISLYGVGFGPTASPAPAGQIYTGPSINTIQDGLTVTIGGQNATVTFKGLIEEGLYQINVVVPQVPSGDALVQANLGFNNPILGANTMTQNNVYIAVQ